MTAPDFVSYGPSHWAALALFALGAILILTTGRHWRGLRAARAFALILLGFSLPFQIYALLPGQWDIAGSLPFHLSDLAWMVAVIALWTGWRWASALLYYWGLTLTPQAMLTPALVEGFPHLVYFMFWGVHILTVWAAIYVTWVRWQHPGWRDLGWAYGATLAWGALMLGFNTLAGTNYLFVNAKPETASILDLLGPWPWYLVWEAVIVLAVWILITWPWVRRSRD